MLVRPACPRNSGQVSKQNLKTSNCAPPSSCHTPDLYSLALLFIPVGHISLSAIICCPTIICKLEFEQPSKTCIGNESLFLTGVSKIQHQKQKCGLTPCLEQVYTGCKNISQLL